MSYAKLGLAASVLVLAACGGGGSSGGDRVVVTPPPPPPPASRYTKGEFRPSSEFKGVCNAEDEKFFLRSFTNETYLWYDEVEDRDPTVASESVQAYFDQLKTFRTTDSGNPVDQFHFYYTDAEYAALQSGESFGYGVSFAFLRSAPENGQGRDIRVRYAADGTAAADAGLVRGAKLVSIDGEDVLFGDDVDTLNDGLFPATSGETHTIGFTPLGSDEVIEVTLTSGVFTFPDILETEVFADTNTAYLNLRTFGTQSAEKSLYDAFVAFDNQDVDNLVVDLRYNGGGYVAVACQLGYMIAGAADTTGQTCIEYVTNDKLADDAPTPFYSSARGFEDANGNALLARGTAFPTLDVDKVTVLSTGGTASASELVINALNGIDQDISLVGTTTRGKPYGFLNEPNCGYVYFTIQFKGLNEKGFGDYADGFIPTPGLTSNQDRIKGCVVSDDFLAFDDPNADVLAAALQYQADGTCPSAATASGSAKTSGGFAMEDDILADIRDPKPGAVGMEREHIVRRLWDSGLVDGLKTGTR